MSHQRGYSQPGWARVDRKSIVYRIFRAKSEVKIFCVNGFRPTKPNNMTNTSVSK